MKKEFFSRRSFIRKSALTSGMAAMGAYVHATGPDPSAATPGKLPREVWIAGISQMDVHTQTPQLMLDEIADIVVNGMVFQPDILCLPETFPVVNFPKELSLAEKLEFSQNALSRFSELAGTYGTYVICPVYTSDGGKAYNAAVVFDRKGKNIGEYRKMHLTIGEIESGLTPGPLLPPVFAADFGRIGIQICYDIYWKDGWESLEKQGADVVFWPSAFAGGNRVNMKALEHQYIVVSSTRKNTSKICDIRGEVISQTGFWDKNFFCASVNLEKVLIDTWPHVSRFNEIRRKYGRKIRLSTLHEEQYTIIESLTPELFVADILREFEIKPYKQEVKEAEAAQIIARNV
jgi:predicted amidohydrolase